MPAYSIDDNGIARWSPTTLRAQGKDESYLERLIAGDPLILGLDPYLTGLGTSFAVFQQTWLDAPSERSLRPDVVLLSETGHVVVVEVKLEDNPELRDRRVISQIVDYAAAVANLDEQAMVRWLGSSQDACWLDLVRRAFPKAHNVERLAAALSDRIARADIHLVVACDRAPVGLRDTMRLISAQAALGEFQLHLVELAPYISDEQPGMLLVIPQETARTEIVSRTAVTVRYEPGQTGAGVTVVASSPVEVEEAIQRAGLGRSIRPEFETLIDAYNLDAPDDLKTTGSALGYRQIKPHGWPGLIHYEFMDQRGSADNFGVELHLEGEGYPGIRDLIEELAAALSTEFPDLRFSNKWFKGCRITVFAPASESDTAVAAMRRLIAASRESIETLLAEATRQPVESTVSSG